MIIPLAASLRKTFIKQNPKRCPDDIMKAKVGKIPIESTFTSRIAKSTRIIC